MFIKWKIKAEGDSNEEDTLEYELKIKCKLTKNASKDDKTAYIDSKGFYCIKLKTII